MTGDEAAASDAGAADIRRVTIVGAVLNVLLALGKLAGGLLASSQALVADAIHSLSDLFTDAAIIVGVKYWVMPADKEHPYGHGKIEGAVTALIGVAVAVVAVEIAWDGIKTLAWGEPKVPGLAAFFVALASVVVKEALYHWTHAVAKRRNSPATEANAWHHRSDAISSLPVAAAVAVAHFCPSLKWLDSAGAVLVGAFILHVAWRIVKPAFEGLTDANCDEASADIERIARGVPGVRGVHHVRTRRYGGTIQTDLHVQVDRSISLVDGHAIGHDVKAAVLAAGIGVTDATIHVEPDVA